MIWYDMVTVALLHHTASCNITSGSVTVTASTHSNVPFYYSPPRRPHGNAGVPSPPLNSSAWFDFPYMLLSSSTAWVPQSSSDTLWTNTVTLKEWKNKKENLIFSHALSLSAGIQLTPAKAESVNEAHLQEMKVTFLQWWIYWGKIVQVALHYRRRLY